MSAAEINALYEGIDGDSIPQPPDAPGPPLPEDPPEIDVVPVMPNKRIKGKLAHETARLSEAEEVPCGATPTPDLSEDEVETPTKTLSKSQKKKNAIRAKTVQSCKKVMSQGK